MFGTTEKRSFEAALRNVDQSSLVYGLFEEKHHLLESLTRRQVELISPFRPRRVLDVGCGTGISSMVLYNFLSSADRPPRIFAIDISESMLSKAKERFRNIPGLYFVRGDADNLESFFHEGFDGIFYTPSIFQIPNLRESIRQACGLLVPDGVITLSYYSGLFTEDGEDAVLKTYPEIRGRRADFSCQEIDSFFESSQDTFRTTWIDFRFEANSECLFDFLSIPAQSSALFPKIPYLDRIPKIREICSALEGKAGPVFMSWKFRIARKGRRLDG